MIPRKNTLSMDWVTVILIIVLSCVQANNIKDIPCKERPVVKEIVSVKQQATPRTVTIFQCSGFSGDVTSRHEKCVPIKQNKVNVHYQVGFRYDRTLELQNHTECAMKCVCAHDGYNCVDKPPLGIPCPDGLEWSWNECKCVATSATCRIVNPGSSESISVGVFVASLVGEFLLLLVMLFLVKFYIAGGCSYKTRLPSTSNNENSDEEETRLCDTTAPRETHESISGTLLDNYDVNQNGYHR